MTKRYRAVTLATKAGKGRTISEAKGPLRGGRSNQYWNPPKHDAPVKTINDTAELKKIQDEVNKGAKRKSDARTRVGGGAPGSFVAGGLARSLKGR